MEIKELLNGFLGKTLNMPAEKVASLFNEDGTVKDNALNDILALDTMRVHTFKSEATSEFDNGYKKAQREVLEVREKEIREKFGVTSNKKGLELIDEIVTTKAGQTVALEPEKVKLHPEYIKLQDELTKRLNETETTWKEKFDSREKQIANEKTFDAISKKADSLLAGKYALPEDLKLSTNQKKLLLMELKEYGFQPNGDDFVIVDKDGKVKNDAHGNRISFETLINDIASNYWPKLDGQQRQGSGADNNANVNGQGANAYKGKIKSEDDYVNAMQNATTAEQRIAIDTEFSSLTGK